MYGSPYLVSVHTLIGQYRSVCTATIWFLNLAPLSSSAQIVIH